MLDSFNSILLTLTFIVPGFIFYEVLSLFLPRKEETTQRWVLRYLSLSFLNSSAWIWLIYLIHNSTIFVERPILSALIWFLIGFLSPLGFALLIAITSQNGRLRHLLIRLGFRVIHPGPSAWDSKFMGSDNSWVIITLDDGGVVGGIFGDNSYASSDPTYRDLYIEKVYKVDDGALWTPVLGSEGMLLNADSIRSIEFLSP